MVKTGLVVRSYSGYYYVDCEGMMVTCKVKGHMKQKRFSLYTGDRVELELNGEGKTGEGMIVSVLPRKNCLQRPTVANLDLLVITLAVRISVSLSWTSCWPWRQPRMCRR